MAKKIRKDDMIPTGEFADIMGVTGQTIRQNILHGFYDEIRVIRTPRGMTFHIFDIFRYAHPNASNDAIERMIFDYRIAKTKARKARQMTKLKAKKLRDKKRG